MLDASRQPFMPPKVGMALLLPLSLSSYAMVLGRGLIVLKPASAWFGPLTLTPVVHSSSSIRASGHMLLTRVIFAATALGLLPFVVHEAKCTQPRQRDPGAWRRANDANLAVPWALIGYFLDPVSLRCWPSLPASSCLPNPFTCLGGNKPPGSASR